jgi:RHS repeat-associated protein
MAMACPNQSSCTATWQSGRTQYVYDADGQRVRQRDAGGVETVYVYDAGGQLAADYTTASSTDSGTQYLTADHLGSTRVVTDSGGLVKARYDYQPFGPEILVPSASPRYPVQGYGAALALRHKFTGKERHAETGLDYFGARYYSAAQGRFTSPDWSAIPQPVPYASLGDPQTFNLYAYVRNSPLNMGDPDGHDPCGVLTGERWVACNEATQGNHSDLRPGIYASSDNRYALIIRSDGRAQLDRTGVDATLGPEFDLAAVAPKLAGAGLFALLRPALRAAGRRLGFEVSADVGIALSRSAIGEALAEEARVLHAGRHLVEAGLIKEGENAAVAVGTRAIASEILSKPIASFITRIGAGAGEIPIRIFVGKAGGRLVGIAIADQAVGAVTKGQIVTSLIIK